jgi:hypothetical protein
MATGTKRFVCGAESKLQQKRKAKVPSVSIRVRQKSKTKLDQLLKKANKDRLGRKVKADDLICFALELITDQVLSEICVNTLSNKDRMELLFKAFSKDRPGATREDFLGRLLEGQGIN